MAADLMNCSSCGRVFAFRGKNICSKCIEKMEKDFILVRRYLQKHAGAGIREIEENTGVEEQTIIQFMREGRLVAESSSNLLNCENCGSSIKEGRYCEKCLYDISCELQSVLPAPEVNRGQQSSSSLRGAMYSRDKLGPMGKNK
ncbi:flagellar protein [hydrocarbon metagenome]|uniref:Flagellar protein n=1 Tax=hydrocarbon metagenome TaxID=938273 RepID=A0A0W8E0Z1_9ZZZZ